jgi:hypothetical protein
MQSERDLNAAPAINRRLSASGYASARIRGQFLIANLELELDLNIPESITYDFLIANKMRFCDSKTFALPRGFSSFQHRASSL